LTLLQFCELCVIGNVKSVPVSLISAISNNVGHTSF